MSAIYDRRSNASRLINFQKIRETLGKNKVLWIGPTVLCTIGGFLHVLTKSDEWKASQALIVRDEAIGELEVGTPLGRFDSNDLLKRSLETILQVAKNPKVAEAALREVGPAKRKSKKFPKITDVEDLIEEISVSAPKGTEFGTSEVVYLSVSAKTPARAVDLTNAVCTHMERRMQQMRDDRARSIIAELQEKLNLADRQLDIATDELSQMEEKLGADLGEMRTLVQAGAGDSNLRRLLNTIITELRQAESQINQQNQLLSLLHRIHDQPKLILSTPSLLLESQPALRRLKDGYVDAQLRTARLQGGLTDDHPRVKAAQQNERNVEDRLLAEAVNAIAATKSDMLVGESRKEAIEKKLADVQSRLDRLASQRAAYANVASEVTQRQEQQRQASVALAEARGRLEAARASSLIARLDSPITGSKPVGPGRLVLLAGSSMGGLFMGLSIVYLIAPWQESRRGRRKTDQFVRRATDSVVPNDRRSRPSEPVKPKADESGVKFYPVETAAQVVQGKDAAAVELSLNNISQIMEAER